MKITDTKLILLAQFVGGRCISFSSPGSSLIGGLPKEGLYLCSLYGSSSVRLGQRCLFTSEHGFSY